MTFKIFSWLSGPMGARYVFCERHKKQKHAKNFVVFVDHNVDNSQRRKLKRCQPGNQT